MADHYSGPRVLLDPASDITDLFAFPSPTQAGSLVLVLDVFPSAGATALFSDAITYRVRARPLLPSGAVATARFKPCGRDYAFEFTFLAPDAPGANGETPKQRGTCSIPGRGGFDFVVGEEAVYTALGLKIFAGARLDPFFMDLIGATTTEQLQKLSFTADATNTLDGANVLSIVFELDQHKVFGPDADLLLGIVAETSTRGSRSFPMERMGRPEIKNVVMSSKTHDTVNKDLEIRDLYNEEDAFNLRPEYTGAYRARLNSNLAFFDRLDGSIDWPLQADGTHPLTELLLDDFLVLDPTKPFSEHGCFEIETAHIAGRAHETCGGRAPNDDVVDTLYTLLVGGINGKRISDGVDQATQPASLSFPYLRPPSSKPTDLLAVLAARLAPPAASE